MTDDSPSDDDSPGDGDALHPDDPPGNDGAPNPDGEIESTPTVACSRCGEEWTLDYELNDLHAGNRAVEQFAMDHHRHTGHYPDDVTPYRVDCQQCPDGEEFLAERPAKRFASTHARHTGHAVEIRTPEGEREILGDE